MCIFTEHIGWLVNDVNLAIDDFSILGYKVKSKIIRDDLRFIDIVFLENENGHCIELVSPYSQKSIVYNLLHKRGSGPYHICTCPKDKTSFLDKLKKNGFVCIDAGKTAVALGDKEVSFYYKVNFGVLEVCLN